MVDFSVGITRAFAFRRRQGMLQDAWLCGATSATSTGAHSSFRAICTALRLFTSCAFHSLYVVSTTGVPNHDEVMLPRASTFQEDNFGLPEITGMLDARRPYG